VVFTVRFNVLQPVRSLVVVALAWCAASEAPAQPPAREPPAAQAPAGPAVLSADDALQQAREAMRRGDSDLVASFAPRIAGHLLEPYYEYWKVSLGLHDVEQDAAVRAFLGRHAGSYLADRLRADWLMALGARGDYQTLQSQMREMIWNREDGQIRCYGVLANYALDAGGHRDALAREGRRLLAASSDPGGDGCTALAERLLDDARLSPWERLRMLVGRGQVAAARNATARIAEPLQAQVRQVLDHASTWLTARDRDLAGAPREPTLIAVALLAREDPARAAALAERIDPKLSAGERGILWSRLGEIAAFKLLPQALDWFHRAGPELATEGGFSRPAETFEWQARAALRATGGPDWAELRAALARMPLEQQREPAWVYWDGRARQAAGDASGAQQRFESIAGNGGFYARLASEEIGWPFDLAPPPPPVTEEDIASMESRIGFTRALKLYRLGMRDEGNHEWGWQLRGMGDRDLRAAAEYARRQGVLDRMISTSDRTNAEIDLAQRFPMPYRQTLSGLVQSLGIDEAWVYGLIRQESRFIEDAHSGSGAQGLMQLLPTTAGYVARRIGLPGYNVSRLTEVDVNLRLGTSYLKLVYDDQGGEPVLASAAYNAGPRRLRQWRQTLTGPMEGAVFVETIPLNETRNYVQKILFNTMVYSALSGRSGVTLKSLLHPVSSTMPVDTDLP
jgi:soluble lytic murein transglycosylase